MTINLFKGTRIIVGVSGSIPASQAADLASRLTQAGADVDASLTESALKFVTPLTFQSVTGRRAYTDADLWGAEAHVLHVGLARGASLGVVPPARRTWKSSSAAEPGSPARFRGTWPRVWRGRAG